MTGLVETMALLRGLHLAATLSLLGTVGFIAWMLPAAGSTPGMPRDDAPGKCGEPAQVRLHRSLLRLRMASGLCAVLAGMAWFAFQSMALVDADNLVDGIAALPLVAFQTRFGNMLMIRLLLLLPATFIPLSPSPRAAGAGVLALPTVRAYIVLALAAVALSLQGFIGHAGATGGNVGDGLVVSEALHLLAAGLWLGMLAPLWFALRTLPANQAAAACEHFSPIGLGCVLVLACSGIIQAAQLIGSVPALLGTGYGHITLLKIALFLGTLMLAAVNRLWLTDRLTSAVNGARRNLLVSVGVEAVLGVAIVAAAAFLASTMPGIHDVPIWPFSWQFSLAAVNQDDELRRTVVVSALLISGAVLLLTAALWWRRYRLPAVVITVAIILRCAPEFTLLITDAYPTSFQASPTGFTAASITHGEALFMQNCVTCHGPDAEGDGPAAAGLDIKPADLTKPHVQAHSDGEMFWWLTHGIDGPTGRLAMPGFANSLSEDDRWALIDFVRAHNAAVAMRRDAALTVLVKSPGFAVTCNGIAASTTEDLHRRVVHVIVGDAAGKIVPVPSQAGIPTATLIVPSDEAPNHAPGPGTCIAEDPSATGAYAVLADLPPDRVAGAEFLIDPNGWLRLEQPMGENGGWHSEAELLAAIREIYAHPIEQTTGGQHDHRL